MRNLDSLINDILTSYETNPDLANRQSLPLPSRNCVTDLTHNLETLIYPGLIDCIHDFSGLSYSVANRVSETINCLKKLIEMCLNYAFSCPAGRITLPECEESVEMQAERLAYEFFEKIPQVRSLLLTDLEAAYRGDPAAHSYAEIILSYPGQRALAVHRLAHLLFEARVPILPRMMSEYVHNRTGIDIHPGAKIGTGFFIDHGTGVVIGETTVIGNDVKLYQGVTLGALSIPDPDSADCLLKRHPTIGDNVTIYSGASILGGHTVVGARSVIGANVWLTHSVDPDTKVLYVPPELRYKQMEH